MCIKKIKFDDCFLTPEESIELNQSSDGLFPVDNFPEDEVYTVEEARKILLENIRLICERHGIRKNSSD